MSVGPVRGPGIDVIELQQRQADVLGGTVVQLCTEAAEEALVEGGGPVVAPSQAAVFSNWQYNQDGVWHDVESAVAFNGGGSLWPIVGNIQDPTVPVGTFEVGGDTILGAHNGDDLWVI